MVGLFAVINFTDKVSINNCLVAIFGSTFVYFSVSRALISSGEDKFRPLRTAFSYTLLILIIALGRFFFYPAAVILMAYFSGEHVARTSNAIAKQLQISDPNSNIGL